MRNTRMKSLDHDARPSGPTRYFGVKDYFEPFERRAFAFRTFAPCFPSAVRVFFGRRLSVCLRFAAAAAFVIFRRAGGRCFAVAMEASCSLRQQVPA
jgi:hypothetical protein